MANPTPPIDYADIAKQNGFTYVGPCGCRGKKGFDYQRGQYVVRCYPVSTLFNIYRYGRLYDSGRFHQLNDKITKLPV